jgi:hypothetical protein
LNHLVAQRFLPLAPIAAGCCLIVLAVTPFLPALVLLVLLLCALAIVHDRPCDNQADDEGLSPAHSRNCLPSCMSLPSVRELASSG